ncbi:hypothetical protein CAUPRSCDRAFT_7976, partial [Caulochytrium protostelioides]
MTPYDSWLPSRRRRLTPFGYCLWHECCFLVSEFHYLLEKSQQLFAGLRDLPPTGRNWQPYFHRTFEVYTKLWKYQQQHRATLESTNNYGLKRWEIGEIASKIGQLYYHYYLRTSETNYLHESFIFYTAIRDRHYFKDVLEAKSSALMIKKLRYYARFIVVCLLLNKNDVIRTLLDELTALIDEYASTFKPTDSAEWNVVLSEITVFLESEEQHHILSTNGTPFMLPNRLVTAPGNEATPLPRPVSGGAVSPVRVQEAILVGNYQNQIKFSELTLDMYRMLQSLERGPSAAGAQQAAAPPPVPQKNPSGNGPDGGDAMQVDDDASKASTNAAVATATKTAGQGYHLHRDNPHKYLLYRPTISQLLMYIATAFKDLADHSVLLLYVSADGIKPKDATPAPSATGTHHLGGVVTATPFPRRLASSVSTADAAAAADTTDAPDAPVAVNCLYPDDLVPFLRKPLFLIMDSTNSSAYAALQHSAFAQRHCCCLLSPTELPAGLAGAAGAEIGNLFTLFLHSPLRALTVLCEFSPFDAAMWSNLTGAYVALETVAADLV